MNDQIHEFEDLVQLKANESTLDGIFQIARHITKLPDTWKDLQHSLVIPKGSYPYPNTKLY